MKKQHMAYNQATHIKTSIPFQLNKSEAHSPPWLGYFSAMTSSVCGNAERHAHCNLGTFRGKK